MKIQIRNIVSLLLLLTLLVACGGESASSNQSEIENSMVKILVQQPSPDNVYLEIVSMVIYVYETGKKTDMNLTNKTLVTSTYLVNYDSVWKGVLKFLEKEKSYIFVVYAKNASGQRIFTGITIKKVEIDVDNEIDINLV